ncbi:hypothetical protein CRUP_017747 [Coryphaenoides rupestris]|nr:hypothetical protein CRUP_017747 [Coryphaenoides rupestris]
MELKSELLKSIWYAFTSLDVEKCGKVSKSQLKVLSHNLYTVLNIPHDPVALEEHFQDDDDGPVSNHGYMPYLNKYILDKVKDGTFDKEKFDDLCWMMTRKKNYLTLPQGSMLSEKDSFKLFCLFNMLSEDRYPLIIIAEEAEYLLKKISAAMSQEWDGKPLEDLLSQGASVLEQGLGVWTFLEHVGAGRLLRVTSAEAFSLALDEVFLEMYHGVLKMAIPDRDGKRCLLCVKTHNKSYEMSASDQRQKVEWIQALQTALRLLGEGKLCLHKELKLKRRVQREHSQWERTHSISSNHSSQSEDSNCQGSDTERERHDQQIESIIQMGVVYSNVDGKRYMHADHVRRQLALQPAAPVKWEQTLHEVYERAAGRAFPRTYELGPGRQLGATLQRVNLKAYRAYTHVDVVAESDEDH